MSAPKFALGERVDVRAILERDANGTRRFWKRFALGEPERGIVVGYRNRHDGRMESEKNEWSGKTSTWYSADRGFQTILVATDLYRGHVVALPEDVSASSSTPLSETPSEVRCSGCGIVAKQIAKPETLVGLQHYCGGTWRRSSLAPLSEPTSEGT